ncbi:MAG: hypothetical protein WBM44_02820 [Waterburya sp.]
MDDVSFNAVKVSLKVHQIACLEHDNNNLYGEVIQLVPHRQLCWFRPMCLVISSSRSSSGSNLSESFSEPWGVKRLQECGQDIFPQQTTKHSPKAIFSGNPKDLSAPYFLPQEAQLINLQSGSDLLWPTILFRAALDSEVICFLAQLHDIKQLSIDVSLNQKYFNRFIHQVWQANQDKF